MAGGGHRRQAKPRYASISTFICNCNEEQCALTATSRYNDTELVLEQEYFETLRAAEIDELAARHVAYNFTRDPMIIFKERIHLDDSVDTDHWENIQSTNWNSVRWKPPPPAKNPADQIGWRTEFRPMEVSLTDFENAAFTVFIVLVSRVIIAFDLNLYIPVSYVDENMERAHARNGLLEQKFWWRRHMAPPAPTDCKADKPDCCEIHKDYYDNYEEMTVAEILNGKGKYFPGLLPMISAYLDTINIDEKTRGKVTSYMSLINARAQGELMTTASWMRKFVMSHPNYKQDSVVTPEIAYDLVKECKEISEGLKEAPELLGRYFSDQIPMSTKDQLYGKPLFGEGWKKTRGREEVNDLITRYAERSDIANKKRRLRREILNKEDELTALRAELAELAGEAGEHDATPSLKPVSAPGAPPQMPEA